MFIRKMFMEYVHDIVKCKNLMEKYVWYDSNFVNIYYLFPPPQKIGRIFTKIERIWLSLEYNYKLFVFYFLIGPYPLKFKKRIF